MLVSYIGLLLFAGAWIGYKAVYKTKWIKLDEIKLDLIEAEKKEH